MQTQQAYISEKVRNSSNVVINPATEDKQDQMISALNNISIDADSVNLNTDGLETLIGIGNTSLSSIAGLTIPAHDYIGASYPDSVTEVYTYKTGGAGGTTVGTITVVYTTSTKDVLTSVTKS